MRKTIVQGYLSFSVQKTARKNNKYWRNETMLKIGHVAKAIALAWAIAFAKWSGWVKEVREKARNVFCEEPTSV